MNNDVQSLIKQRDDLTEELRREYELQYVKLDTSNMTVGPGIHFDDLACIWLFVEYRKGKHNSLTEKANRIQELNYQIDLLNKDVESRNGVLNAVISLIPGSVIKE